MIRKRRNQKEIPTPKTEVGKTKLTITSGKQVRAMNTPLNPHFYIVKLGFAGVYLFFLFLLQT